MRFRNLIPTEAKLRIFKAFILPQVTYCHIVWHHCRSSDERKLERLQERALRAIYCDRTSTYEALLENARLPTLCNRRLQDMAIFMYKVKANLVPSYIFDLFSCDMSRYNLRNTEDFSLPRCNTVTYGRHSLKGHCHGLTCAAAFTLYDTFYARPPLWKYRRVEQFCIYFAFKSTLCKVNAYKSTQEPSATFCKCKSACTTKRKENSSRGCPCKGRNVLCTDECKCGTSNKPCRNRVCMHIIYTHSVILVF